MSTTDDTASDLGSPRPASDSDRRFELAAVPDDGDDPTELTVFPRDTDDKSLVTTWLTMDVEHVLELQEMR